MSTNELRLCNRQFSAFRHRFESRFEKQSQLHAGSTSSIRSISFRSPWTVQRGHSKQGVITVPGHAPGLMLPIIKVSSKRHPTDIEQP
jgi:hypothetical protein